MPLGAIAGNPPGTTPPRQSGRGCSGGWTSEPALIPWDQAVAVGRRIIELARARGDIS
jgi:hypothetical protein